tara:strand:- start:234 stop:374 length:141 start_codon:yes stop_codon:yes gene_type:complete
MTKETDIESVLAILNLWLSSSEKVPVLRSALRARQIDKLEKIKKED